MSAQWDEIYSEVHFFAWKNKAYNLYKYRKIASSNTSRLEAHVGFFRLLMKGIFGPYVLWPFDKMLIFQLVTHIRTCDYTVPICTNKTKTYTRTNPRRSTITCMQKHAFIQTGQDFEFDLFKMTYFIHDRLITYFGHFFSGYFRRFCAKF